MSAPATWDPPADGGEDDERKMRLLLRAVATIIAVPALTITAAYLLFEDFGPHAPHIVLYGLVSAAAVTVFALAPRLARRWT